MTGAEIETISYIVVVALLVLIPLLGNTLLRRRTPWMETLPSNVYPIPPFALGSLLTVLALLAIVILLPLLAYLTGSDVDREDVLVILGTMALPAAFTVYTLVANSGTVVLDDEAVTLRRLGLERRLPYRDILSIRERSGNPFFPSLVLKGRRRTLRINRRVERLPDLYANIRARLVALPAQSPILPFKLQPTTGVVLQNVLGLPLLAAFLLAIALGIDYERNPQPIAAAIMVGLSMAATFALILFLFWRLELKPHQPIRLEFHADEVRFRLPLKPWQSWPVEQLQEIGLQSQVTPVRVKSRGTWVSESAVEYPLVLLFRGARALRLDERRCWQLGYSPQQLVLLLRQLYGLDQLSSVPAQKSSR